MKTFVYVDGFNLYHRHQKNSEKHEIAPLEDFPPSKKLRKNVTSRLRGLWI